MPNPALQRPGPPVSAGDGPDLIILANVGAVSFGIHAAPDVESKSLIDRLPVLVLTHGQLS